MPHHGLAGPQITERPARGPDPGDDLQRVVPSVARVAPALPGSIAESSVLEIPVRRLWPTARRLGALRQLRCGGVDGGGDRERDHDDSAGWRSGIRST